MVLVVSFFHVIGQNSYGRGQYPPFPIAFVGQSVNLSADSLFDLNL